ncbi:MAG: hypothetical protein RL240_4213, partial [Planctomycetota bacterium]
ANSQPSSSFPPSGEEWLRRFVVTVMNGSPPYFCASVPLRLCVSKKSHRTIRPSMRGRLETRRHRVHRANSQPSSSFPPSGEEWLRRFVVTVMNGSLCASVPLCLCVSPPPRNPPISDSCILIIRYSHPPRTAFLPHRRNSQRCKPAAVFSK